MKRVAIWAILTCLIVPAIQAQTKTIGLDEAVKLGIQNSKKLKLSSYQIDAALQKVEQEREANLPSLKVSAGYSHALMLSRSLSLPSSDGQDPKSLQFPFDNVLYQAGVSVSQPVYSGNRFRYARESADLLVKLSRLNAEVDQDEVMYTIVSAYINYYSLLQNQKVVDQNLQDISKKLEEIRKFENQGLATRNDVLRYELQQSEIMLSSADLENNRLIANYNMNLLLGLPDSTELHIEDISYKLDAASSLQDYLDLAAKSRKEFGTYHYQQQINDLEAKKVKSERLPNVALAGNLYYINPTKALMPKSGSYLAPLLLGVNVSWDISSFFKTKNKLAATETRSEELNMSESLFADQVKSEIYSAYRKYELALQKIKVKQTSLEQAAENERIMESKYKNNLATTTDRIDAQTLLYNARTDLELARTSATQAYYDLLKATGQLHTSTNP